MHDAEDGKVTILARQDTLPARKAVVDFSSPNIAKEMHVGHLRSTIIGETICRTLESIGVETVRLNHVGDWGTQFGMLLTHLSDKTDADFEIRDLQAFYKESKLRFDSDEEFKLRSQAAVVKLQYGDEEMIAKWKRYLRSQRQEFEEFYRLLDIKIEERGESFYNSMIPDVLDELIEKKLLSRTTARSAYSRKRMALHLFVEKVTVDSTTRPLDPRDAPPHQGRPR